MKGLHRDDPVSTNDLIRVFRSILKCMRFMMLVLSDFLSNRS